MWDPTPGVRYPIYSWHMISGLWNQKSDICCPISDIWYLTFECLIFDIWISEYLISEISGLRSDGTWLWFWHRLSDIWYPISEILYMRSDVRHLISELRNLNSDIWYPISDIGYPSIGDLSSEIWDQLISVIWYLIFDIPYTRSDIRYQIFDIWCMTPDVWVSGIKDFLSIEIWDLMFDSWYMKSDIRESDIRYPRSDVWYLDCQIWYPTSDIRYPVFHVWHLIAGIRCLVSNIWFLKSEIWYLFLVSDIFLIIWCLISNSYFQSVHNMVTPAKPSVVFYGWFASYAQRTLLVRFIYPCVAFYNLYSDFSHRWCDHIKFQTAFSIQGCWGLLLR